MVSTVMKVWHKSRYLGDAIHGPVSKTDAIVINVVHVDRKISFDGIKDEFDWSINGIIWSTKDYPMPSSENHVNNLSMVMRT